MAKMIPLTQGKHAQVDDQDFERLSRWAWYAVKNKRHRTWYAVRSGLNGSQIRMHREILGVTSPEIEVDHRDGDGLNNQRFNLRECTQHQNKFNRGLFRSNTTGYKGVVFVKYNNRSYKYRAQLRLNKKLLYFGFYDTPEEAARAYDAAAKECFGEFARLNFPREPRP